MRVRSVSQAIIDHIASERVDHIFVGPPTNHQFAFLDALYDRQEDVRPILVRHEAMAPWMAEGWFRATGRPGVFHVGTGPGLANAVVGVMSAYTCGSAIVGITGQVHSAFWGNNGMQEIQSKTYAEGHRIVDPIVKRYWQLVNADKTRQVMHHAFSAALTGRPGPVLVDIPMNLFEAEAEFEEPDPSRHRPAWQPAGHQSAIAAAVDLLCDSKAPVILLGGGVLAGHACDEAVHLAERLQSPVVTTFNGKSAIPADHPLAIGPVGAVGTLAASEAIQTADTVLALGTRFHEWLTSGWERARPFDFTDTRLIQVDIESSEIGRVYPVDVGIHADVKQVLNSINELLGKSRPRQARLDSGRTRSLQQRRHEQVAAAREALSSVAVPIRPERVVRELRQLTPRDAILMPDAGNNGSVFDLHWDAYLPGTYIRDNGIHAMGYAPAAALGVKLARPGQQVIAVTGDGCMTQVNWVLGTAAEYGIPVKFIVLNNGALAGSLSAQESVFEGRVLCSRFEYHTGDEPYQQNFEMLANSYGVDASRVHAPDEVQDALREMLESSGPYLVDIVTDAHAVPKGAGSMWISSRGSWGQ